MTAIIRIAVGVDLRLCGHYSVHQVVAMILWINPFFLELKYMETDEHNDAPSCAYAHLGIKTSECRP
jgi:hypothetical protein